MSYQAMDLCARLNQHLNILERDRSANIDYALVHHCGRVLPQELNQPEDRTNALSIIVRVTSVAARLSEGPEALLELGSKLIDSLPFDDLWLLRDEINQALHHKNLPMIQHIGLKILEKATESSKYAAMVAYSPMIIISVMKIWLDSVDTGIGDRATNLFTNLLRVDKESEEVSVHGIGSLTTGRGGQGVMWRRMFTDRDVYEVFYIFISPISKMAGVTSQKHRSIAQTRMMTFVQEAAGMDWDYVAKSHIRSIEQEYGLKPGEGLLHALCFRTDGYGYDVLLHLNYIQFFCALLEKGKKESEEDAKLSKSLAFLTTTGIHKQSRSYWLQQNDSNVDAIERSFLTGASAEYNAKFVSHYPETFLSNKLAVEEVLVRLNNAFRISTSYWSSEYAPVNELQILGSLPRICLFPSHGQSNGRSGSPLFKVRSDVPCDAALVTLATIFSASDNRDPFISRYAQNYPQTEHQAARALYFLYLYHNPDFHRDLVRHANTIALTSTALASIDVMCSFMSANWSVLPSESSYPSAGLPQSMSSLPSEGELTTATGPIFGGKTLMHHAHPIEMFLCSPGRDVLVPYILGPPIMFTNTVGGLGDQESSAYKVASAKWQCLQILQQGVNRYRADMENTVGRDENLLAQAQYLKMAIRDRMAEGIWGGIQEDVGGRIATLEL